MPKDEGGVPPKEDTKFDVSLLEKLQTDPTSITPDEAKLISENSKALFNQKNHWKEKAVDPETGKPYKDLLSDKKVEPPKESPPTEDLKGVKESVDKLTRESEKRTFGYQEKLDPEETDEVFAYAQGMGITPKEALAKPFIKGGIESRRAQKRAEGAVPGSSNRTAVVEGKDWNKMSEKERRENFGAVVQNFRK